MTVGWEAGGSGTRAAASAKSGKAGAYPAAWTAELRL